MRAPLIPRQLRLGAALGATMLVAACARPASSPSDRVPPLQTVAEASGYTRTAPSEEVERFLDTLDRRSPLIHVASIGRSLEGREIPLAVIADPPVASAAAAREDERLTVLLLGNIHAGEVCGKEALLAIARELVTAPDHPLLDDLIVCLIPNYNPDGNDRFSPANRPGQVGPERMGTRANAQGLDLNRDYIKAEAPETRALLRFLDEWDPALTVDTHTTNGSRHRYTLTYRGPKHPSTDTRLLEYARDTMLPEIDRAFEAATPYLTFFYGNFWESHTLWVTYPAEPRYGVVYRGLRNRLSILSEAYAYATFGDRVLATEAYCRAVLEYAATNAREIRTLVREADRRTIEAGRARAPVHLRNEARPFPEPITVLGYDTASEGAAGAPRDHRVLFVNDFHPTLTVPRPGAYAIPAALTPVIDLLRAHGIRAETLEDPMEVRAVACVIEAFERADRAFQGHRMIREVRIALRPIETTLPAGTVIVPTDQPLGTLASLLLEPQSSDGVVAWNLMDEHLAPGATYPILRIP